MRNWVIFSILGLIPVGLAFADVPQHERDALEALFISANGPGWTQNDRWEIGGTDPVCVPGNDPNVNWENVTCEYIGSGPPEDMTVVQLLMNEINLVGQIPVELWDLSNLEFLYLSANQLSGDIPAPSPGQLLKLRSLWLYNNQLTGFIPPELGGLVEMRKLRLGQNNLSGQIPASLGNLSQMELLNLYDNQLTGPIPVSFEALSKLQQLWLHDNQLSGNIPPNFGAIQLDMENLRLDHNGLTGSIPSDFGSMVSLNYVNLSHNQLSGGIPSTLGALSALTEIDLANNNLSGEIPWQFGNLHPFVMKRILLQNNYLTGEIPPELGDLLGLFWLDLSDNRLDGAIPWQLGNLGAMDKMYLNSNKLSGTVPDELESSTSRLGKGYGVDLRWNALTTANDQLRAWLDLRQRETLEWSSYQTVPPTNLTRRGGLQDRTVGLIWDGEVPPYPTQPNPDPGMGGYEMSFREVTTPLPAFQVYGRTSRWDVMEMPVGNLNPDTEYDFRVAAYTKQHGDNPKNVVTSEPSVYFTETTAAGSCASPVISTVWNGGVATLSVTVDVFPGSSTSYVWSTGSTSATIDVSPSERQDFWVTVGFTNPSSEACEEADIETVDAGLFFDGFETGDTSGWSGTTP